MMLKHTVWLAINIYHEARGEGRAGQIAVGHVVLNRAIKNGESVKKVILKPWQFSWHNHNTFPPITDYDALESSLNAAHAVLEERLDGKNLDGADHYFATYIDRPSWADKMTKVAEIGQHVFYRS